MIYKNGILVHDELLKKSVNIDQHSQLLKASTVNCAAN